MFTDEDIAKFENAKRRMGAIVELIYQGQSTNNQRQQESFAREIVGKMNVFENEMLPELKKITDGLKRMSQ